MWSNLSPWHAMWTQAVRKWKSQILKITQWKSIKARGSFWTKTIEQSGSTTSVTLKYILRKFWKTSRFIAVSINSNRDGRGTITVTRVCNMRKEKIIGKQNMFVLTVRFFSSRLRFIPKFTRYRTNVRALGHSVHIIYSLIKVNRKTRSR